MNNVLSLEQYKEIKNCRREWDSNSAHNVVSITDHKRITGK
jgi:hypothetical protein